MRPRFQGAINGDPAETIAVETIVPETIDL